MVKWWFPMRSDSQQKVIMQKHLIQHEAELQVQMLGLISSVQFDQPTWVQPSYIKTYLCSMKSRQNEGSNKHKAVTIKSARQYKASTKNIMLKIPPLSSIF